MTTKHGKMLVSNKVVVQKMDKPKTTKSKVLLQNSWKTERRVDVNLMSALFSYYI